MYKNQNKEFNSLDILMEDLINNYENNIKTMANVPSITCELNENFHILGFLMKQAMNEITYGFLWIRPKEKMEEDFIKIHQEINLKIEIEFGESTESFKLYVESYEIINNICKIKLMHYVYKLNFTKEYKIFTNQSYKNILNTVCKSCELLSIEIDRKEPLILQYNETTWNFIKRLCRRLGLYIKCQENTNDITIMGKIPQDIKWNSSELKSPSYFYNFFSKYYSNYNSIKITSYNRENPNDDLVIKMSKDPTAPIYEKMIVDNTYKTMDEGNILCKYYLESLNTKGHYVILSEKLEAFQKVIYKDNPFYVSESLYTFGFDLPMEVHNYGEKKVFSTYVLLEDCLRIPQYEQPVIKIETMYIKNKNNALYALDSNGKFMGHFHFDRENIVPIEPTQELSGASNKTRMLLRNGEPFLALLAPTLDTIYRIISYSDKENPMDTEKLREQYWRHNGCDQNSVDFNKLMEIRFITSKNKTIMQIHSTDEIQINAKHIKMDCETLTIDASKEIKIKTVNWKEMIMSKKNVKSTEYNIEVITNYKLSALNITLNAIMNFKVKSLKSVINAMISVDIEALLLNLSSKVKTESKAIIHKMSSIALFNIDGLIIKVEGKVMSTVRGMINIIGANVMLTLQSSLLTQQTTIIFLQSVAAIYMCTAAVKMWSGGLFAHGGFALIANGFARIGCPF